MLRTGGRFKKVVVKTGLTLLMYSISGRLFMVSSICKAHLTPNRTMSCRFPASCTPDQQGLNYSPRIIKELAR